MATWNRFLKGLLLIVTGVSCFGLTFPDTLNIRQNCETVRREQGFPVEFSDCRMLGKKSRITLRWLNAENIEVVYYKTKPFGDKEFSDISALYGKGGGWYETPVSAQARKTVGEIFPGLEQQWILKTYSGEMGWMGSGTVNTSFFLAFRNFPPSFLDLENTKAVFHSHLLEKIKSSGSWISIPCSREDASSVLCFKSLTNSQVRLKILSSIGKTSVELWLDEFNQLSDIHSTINTLSRDKFHEYSSELTDFGQIESQNALKKVSYELSQILDWPVWKLESLKDGGLTASDYEKLFNTQGTDWAYIPVMRYRSDSMDIDIRLYFTGQYQIIMSGE